MWKIAVSKKEMLLKVAKFKYSPFFEGSCLMTSPKMCTMYVTLHLKNQLEEITDVTMHNVTTNEFY